MVISETAKVTMTIKRQKSAQKVCQYYMLCESPLTSGDIEFLAMSILFLSEII